MRTVQFFEGLHRADDSSRGLRFGTVSLQCKYAKNVLGMHSSGITSFDGCESGALTCPEPPSPETGAAGVGRAWTRAAGHALEPLKQFSNTVRGAENTRAWGGVGGRQRAWTGAACMGALKMPLKTVF